MADRAFSRQGKNEKFSRQFYHNRSKEVSIVHKSVVRWAIIFGVRSGSAPLGLSIADGGERGGGGGGEGGCDYRETFVTLVDGIFYICQLLK